MLRLPGGRALAAKTLYGLCCIAASLVLVVAAIGYYAQTRLDSIGTSQVAAGGPSTGAMNILIMGLESRTYLNGTPLDHHLDALPGHRVRRRGADQHADLAAHLRRRAEGGRLLHPPR